MAWELNQQQATLKANAFVATFDMEQPYLGLRVDHGQTTETSQLFAFLVPDSPVESYIRGDDLANRYPPRNSDLVSYQTYYRMTSAAWCITAALSAAPITQVTSAFDNAELLYMPSAASECRVVDSELTFEQDDAPRFFLVRPNESDDHSWALFVHPTDFHRGSVRTTPTPAVAFHVFPDSLEKGVIRRATFKVHLVARENDAKQAADLLAEAEHASPPLTT